MNEVVATEMAVEAAKEVGMELVPQAAQTVAVVEQAANPTVGSSIMTTISNNKKLIFWTLVFAGLAIGGYYMYEQSQKNNLITVEDTQKA